MHECQGTLRARCFEEGQNFARVSDVNAYFLQIQVN